MGRGMLIFHFILVVLVLAVSTKVLFSRALRKQKWAPHRSGKPTIVICGSSNAGKTVLYHQLTDTKAASTLTSIAPNVGKFENLRLVDCPGNEKLSHYLIEELSSNVKCVVFMVDASNGLEVIKKSAPILFKVLNFAVKHDFPILIAANKMDQFSAVSVNKVRSLLEEELANLRDSKLKGLDADDENDEEALLGDVGSSFSFSELDSSVEVLGGSALSGDVDKWIDWLQE